MFSEPIHIRRGANYPHWTRSKGIYAMNFRLADSMSQMRLRLWQAERDDILRTATALHRRLSNDDRRRLDYLYSERIERFLRKGYGDCWLAHESITSIVAKTFTLFDDRRYKLFAWCIMPNHVHVVLQPWTHSLVAILASWKRFTARKANALLKRKGAFWQGESYDRLIRNFDELRHHITYAWCNPEMAGLTKWKWRWKMRANDVEAFITTDPRSPWHENQAASLARIPRVGDA